ncbi:MAG: hypothetical protein ACI4C1_00520 [Lachnospiraceae bacterium]
MKVGQFDEEVERQLEGIQTKDNHGNWANRYFYGLLEEDWRKQNDSIDISAAVPL